DKQKFFSAQLPQDARPPQIRERPNQKQWQSPPNRPEQQNQKQASSRAQTPYAPPQATGRKNTPRNSLRNIPAARTNATSPPASPLTQTASPPKALRSPR